MENNLDISDTSRYFVIRIMRLTEQNFLIDSCVYIFNVYHLILFTISN